MRVKKYVTLFVAMALTAVSLIGCAEKNSGPYIGEWAYIHDDKTVALDIKDNGEAVFDGENYTYTVNDPYLIFKASDGTEKNMRYEMDGDNMLFYVPNTYIYEGEGSPEGLAGLWKDSTKKWSFEFTEDGTFKEDGYFPGYYQDMGDGSVKMVYNDHFPDTVMYYTIEGDELRVEYPWTMVKPAK